MDAKFFECIVCFEACRDCINCLKCNPILCKSHVAELHRDQCPSCRDEPFHYQENVALQRIICQMNAAARVAAPTGEPRENVAARVEPEESAEEPEEEPDAEDSAEEAATVEPVETAEETEAEDNDNNDDNDSISRYGSKVPRPHPYEDQYRKLPNDAHKEAMLAHVHGCQDSKCHTLWRGPWGSFIGGRKGKTHFHLTNCPAGKRLNELIGWDYDDPHC
ncbi:expressed unknown protein [Seminavis robusta]|uniref:Uncharacterized protein n=1 Tax=Seminavis robusta TaxID=568900 RepID=A0A9N8HCI7_9STRA|nr:expressed unknown protein [Seminavis robusta]|eukprot:Sro219_g090490.1 n/a (220) ;mRNA; f:55628-56287